MTMYCACVIHIRLTITTFGLEMRNALNVPKHRCGAALHLIALVLATPHHFALRTSLAWRIKVGAKVAKNLLCA